MSKVYAAIVNGSSYDSLITCDEANQFTPVRFPYADGGWAARTAFLARRGERYLDISGSSQGISVLTGMPVSTKNALDPIAAAMNPNAGAGACAAAVIGTIQSVPTTIIGLPQGTLALATDLGKPVKMAAGLVELCTAATDVPIGILTLIPDNGVAGAICGVCIQGVCVWKGMATGPSQMSRLVLAAGPARVALAADFITSTGAGTASTGARAIGVALEGKGNNVDFLGYFFGPGGLAFLT